MKRPPEIPFGGPVPDEDGNLRCPMGSGRFVSKQEYLNIVENMRDTWDSDVAHCEKTVAGLRDPWLDQEPQEGFGPCGERSIAVPGEGRTCRYPDCDCYNSEIIMLSSGYADAMADGKIIQHGVVVYEVP